METRNHGLFCGPLIQEISFDGNGEISMHQCKIRDAHTLVINNRWSMSNHNPFCATCKEKGEIPLSWTLNNAPYLQTLRWDGLCYMFEIVEGPVLRNLKTLILSNTQLQDQEQWVFMVQWIESSSNLKTLSIQSYVNAYHPDLLELERLFYAFPPTLTSLNFDVLVQETIPNFRLNYDQVFFDVVSARLNLLENWSRGDLPVPRNDHEREWYGRLKQVKLSSPRSFQFLHNLTELSCHRSKAYLDFILQFIQQSRTLQRLDLHDFEVHGRDPEDLRFRRLCETLTLCCKKLPLQYVQLEYEGFTTVESFSALATLFETATSLQTFWIWDDAYLMQKPKQHKQVSNKKRQAIDVLRKALNKTKALQKMALDPMDNWYSAPLRREFNSILALKQQKRQIQCTHWQRVSVLIACTRAHFPLSFFNNSILHLIPIIDQLLDEQKVTWMD
jgi:hypothetical protein